MIDGLDALIEQFDEDNELTEIILLGEEGSCKRIMIKDEDE